VSELSSCEVLPGPAIRCLICDAVSFHPTDISEKYCSRCSSFHETMTTALQSLAMSVRLISPQMPNAEILRLFKTLLVLIGEANRRTMKGHGIQRS